jgi:hypothetical protein
MVQQVPIVGILMIVHGALVALMGLLYAIMGPTMLAMFQLDQNAAKRPDDQTMMTIMSIVYIGCGLLVLGIGALHVISGIQCMRFRGRTLAIATLFCNIPVLMTCYCAPTGIGITVYGLIVLFQNDVAQAFAMAAQGATVAEIKNAFDPRRRHGRADDFADRREEWGGTHDRPDQDAGPQQPRDDDRIQPG